MKKLRRRVCLLVGAVWIVLGFVGVADVDALAITFGGVCVMLSAED